MFSLRKWIVLKKQHVCNHSEMHCACDPTGQAEASKSALAQKGQKKRVSGQVFEAVFKGSCLSGTESRIARFPESRAWNRQVFPTENHLRWCQVGDGMDGGTNGFFWGAPMLHLFVENAVFFRVLAKHWGTPKTAVPTTTHPIPHLTPSDHVESQKIDSESPSESHPINA